MIFSKTQISAFDVNKKCLHTSVLLKLAYVLYFDAQRAQLDYEVKDSRDQSMGNLKITKMKNKMKHLHSVIGGDGNDNPFLFVPSDGEMTVAQQPSGFP